ncbi:hypothetical protein MTR_3g050055 [Medicago truncatula]|uniref:Uncharacterized protein n=1 Tax=Medicago truncatula TaxID=3880 RepID=A0A072V6M5_MEDTR|nr:hypothetical protein MTR_3g050055 [Medicago truncatula]
MYHQPEFLKITSPSCLRIWVKIEDGQGKSQSLGKRQQSPSIRREITNPKVDAFINLGVIMLTSNYGKMSIVLNEVYT